MDEKILLATHGDGGLVRLTMLTKTFPMMTSFKPVFSRLMGLALSFGIAALAANAATAATTSTKKTDRWEPRIVKFEQQDAKTSPTLNGILFVGSSSIVGWDVDKYFPGLPVINRGFGGSQVSDVLNYFERVVVPYKPKAIVFYSGDNDIAAKKTPEHVFNDVKTFVQRVENEVPSVEKIIIIPPKPSISRWSMWPDMKRVAELEKTLQESHPAVVVVDMSPDMLGADGEPRPELLKKDKLHMTPAGYDIWTQNVMPYLK